MTASRLFWLLLPLAAAACERTEVKDPDGTVGGLEDSLEDADGDGFVGDDDCADGDASVNPGAAEICDGIDNNCDGQVDEGVTRTFYADADRDGFGDPTTTAEACEQPPDHAPSGTDCDDNNPGAYPGAEEWCNGIDDDCSGEIDDGLGSLWYADADGDGYGDAATEVETCSPDPGMVERAGDCDDSEPEAFPGNTEVCDEIDNDCNGGVDEGQTAVYYVDLDGDGWGDLSAITEACAVPAGYAELAGDCDDADLAINPDATEVCNGVDDDCDGSIDGPTATDATAWATDADGDGYGTAVTVLACTQPTGFVAPGTLDCDDTNPTTNPAASETCDGEDDDCDGAVDEDSAIDAPTWYVDADGDGHGVSSSTTVACAQPAGFAATDSDCDDSDSAVSPSATEVCNGQDDDCDGLTDDADSAVTGTDTFYADTDLDGYGDAATTTSACAAPSGFTDDPTDCDDTDADINPDATEVCNGQDDDCDGDIDDDDADVTGTATWYSDVDGDGYGDPTAAAYSCSAPTGTVADGTDCDDADAAISPGSTEVCNGEDDDCDGDVDDGVLGTGASCPAEDCAEILADNPSAADGTYELDAGTYTCDMTTDGGGWTLVGASATVYGTGYTGAYYNTEGFSWSETLFEYDAGSVHAHCTYPSALTGCNNIGFQFASESWGVAQNWGSSLCGMSTTSYTSSTTYIGGYDWVIDRTESSDTIRVGTLEGIAGCTTGDNPGSATLNLWVRR